MYGGTANYIILFQYGTCTYCFVYEYSFRFCSYGNMYNWPVYIAIYCSRPTMRSNRCSKDKERIYTVILEMDGSYRLKINQWDYFF